MRGEGVIEEKHGVSNTHEAIIRCSTREEKELRGTGKDFKQSHKTIRVSDMLLKR